MAFVRVGGWVVMAALMGCGPAVGEGDGSASSAADTSAGSEGGSSGMVSASGDSSSVSDSTPASSDGGSTGVEPPLGCGVPPDEEGEMLTVTLRNLAPFPVLMGRDAGCEFEPFDLAAPNGEFITWHRSSCANSCESIASGDCIFCGACAGSTFLRLDTGAEYEIEWPQTRVDSMPVPADCANACEPTCGHISAVEGGEYTFTAFVRGACEGDECLCPPGESACLVTLEEPQFPDTVSFTTTSVLPADAIEIVFE